MADIWSVNKKNKRGYPFPGSSFVTWSLKGRVNSSILLIVLCLLLSSKTFAGAETIPTGSKIINMGVTPQTTANGLKPYGLVYALLQNNTPVKWIINQNKVKDGIDFTHNGVNYKGSAFIISAEFITSAVNTIIAAWTSQGVVVNTSVSPFTANVVYNLSTAPRWVVDAGQQTLSKKLFDAAGIPASAWITKNPAQLTNCEDIFVMPHADVTWKGYKNLYYWNQIYKGNIWAGCYAAATLEDTYGPDINNPAINRELNFLMNDASNGSNQVAVPFANHTNPTPPFNYQYSADPIMQFMGKTDNAQMNGPEQVYLPDKPSSWRSTTSIGVYDPSQSDIPSKSKGPAALIAYGRAYGDTSRGWVMYEAGHDISGTTEDNVAAARAFFNFSLVNIREKQPFVTANGIPAFIPAYSSANFTAVATSQNINPTFTYQWISSVGGTFSNPTSAVTTFTVPGVATLTSGTITCRVTDNCARVAFDTRAITIIPVKRAPISANDVVTIPSCATTATINVLSNDTDPDGGALTVTLIGSGSKGTFTNTGNGIITYTPSSYFNGSDQVQYQICNPNNLCSTSTITVNVNALDANGCSPNQYYGLAYTVTASIATTYSGGPSGLSNALGKPDGVNGNSATYASLGNNNGAIFSLSAAIPATGTLYVYTDGNSSANSFSLEQSTDSTNWTGVTNFTTTSSDDFLDANKKSYTVNAGTKWIRLKSASTSVYVDAFLYNYYSCISALPVAVNDVAATLEDVPVTINVLANDKDPQGLNLTVNGISVQPKRGRVSVNIDNTITYINLRDNVTPAADTFSYRVINAKGLASTATVIVNITPDGCPVGQYKSGNLSTFTTTATLYSTIDSYISRINSTTNYGTLSSLYIKGSSTDTKRTLLQFDLSSIPAGAVIDAASLQLYHTAGAISETVDLYRLTKQWTETGVTWNKADALNSWATAGGDGDPTVVASTNLGTTLNTYKAWDVLSLARGWYSGAYPNNGVALIRNPESTATTDIVFNSNNAASNKPQLLISYRALEGCAAIPSYPPLAMPDSVITNAVTPIDINVASNDYDYNNTGLTVNRLSLTSVKGGTIARTGNLITYTPPATTPAFNGLDSFKYKVTSSGLADSAYVYVLVTDAPPYANPDTTYTLQSNTAAYPSSITANVLINDYDPEGAGLSAPVITMGPKFGTAVVSGSSIVYTPNQNYLGGDTLIYQIAQSSGTGCSTLTDTALVTFTVTNRPPVATADSSVLNACEIVTFNPLTNDMDPEGGSMTLKILSQPSLGSVALTNNNTQIIYSPPSGLNNVSTTFTYQACDSTGTVMCGNSVTYKISVRVPPAVNNPPIAVRDTFRVNRNAVLYADVLTNDTEPDGQAFAAPLSIVTNATRGALTVLENNLVQYTPNLTYYGLDSFQYRVYDSVLQVGGCAPIPQLSATAWAYVIVQDVPIADWDKTRTMTGQAVTMNVLSNDIFGYYGPATGAISIITQPSNGTASVLTNGSPDQSNNSIRYTSNSTFKGLDSLIYQVTDANGTSDTAIAYIWVVPDSDGDGVADDIDIDDDNDGIPDYVEVCGAGATGWSCTPNNSDPSGDDDNDGIVNYKDADWATLNSAGCAAFLDSDGDGVPNYLDRDSDNDGIPDVIESLGVDANGDGVIDNFCDTDGDGLSQNVDANNTGAAGSGQGLGAADFDGDGVPNYLDLDSDNDGIPDIVESYGTDTNNDGRVDNFTDADGDGWANIYDGDADGNGVVENLAGVLILTGPDPNYVSCASPGTGHPSCYAYRGNADNNGYPNFLDLDSDGDGITDANESGIVTANYFRGMVSGCTLTDGWCASIKAMPSLNLTNTDNVGRPDVYDIDSDNDGITDNVEGQPTGSYVVPTDADTDGDGIADVYDIYNGIGGNGITPYDHDNDGIPDYMDLDTDNDGAPDRNEGDKRYATLTQATINASGDSDGDGLMDYFDTYNLSTQSCLTVYRNVSMSNMGPAGNYDGPTPPGSNVQLVKSLATAMDRDWRNNATLRLQIINFAASLSNNIVGLTWKVENEQQVEQYVVERSANGNTFDEITNVKSANQSAVTYNYDDKLTGFTAATAYYRIKQVNKNGEVSYTKILSFNLTKAATNKLTVYPVPVTDALNIGINSSSKQIANIAICDASGKVLIQKNVALEKGDNKVVMPEARQLLKGLFVIRVKMIEATMTEKGIKE
jgi:hypothetical protein